MELVHSDYRAIASVLDSRGIARVDAPTVRKLKNVGDDDALYFVVGGKDGYVGRDGKMPEGEKSPRGSQQLPPS